MKKIEVNTNEFNIKEAILNLHELMGNFNITFEYPELPNKEVNLTVEDKEEKNDD